MANIKKCDRCGLVCDISDNVHEISYKPSYCLFINKYDLCENCSKEFDKWLNGNSDEDNKKVD